MGWRDKLKSFGSKVCGGGKALFIDAPVAATKATGRGLKATGCAAKKHIIDPLTGKTTADEAKKLYKELEAEVKSREKDYSKFVDEYSKKIKFSLSSIESLKEKLRKTHFKRFIEQSSRFSEWEIAENSITNDFSYEKIKLDSLKPKSSYISIDFDESPFKSYFKASFFLGLFSRKAAKESLHKVKDAKKQFEAEWPKINTEKTRLKNTLASVQQVESFFKDLVVFYEELQGELDYSISLLSNTMMVINPHYNGKKLDCYFLPEKHLLTLMACDKMTRILYSICKLQIFDSKQELIKKDLEFIRKEKRSASELKLKLAA